MFWIGIIAGTFIGITIMCLLQINKEENDNGSDIYNKR